MSKIVDSQLSIYKSHFDKHGDSPEGTYNQNDAAQNLRFDALIKQLPLRTGKFSLHDVGCGICDLHQYFLDQSIDVHYSGTDIVPEMRDLATSKYPDVKFEVRDILEQSDDSERYDFLVLAGTFNLPGDSDRALWTDFANAMIKKMFEMATHGISFNFLTAHADFYHPDMYYRDPGEVLEYCTRNLSRHVVIDHAYPLYEFTVTVFKEEHLKELHRDERLQKYFKQ